MKLNIDTLVSIIVSANIDITTDFNDWTKVAFAIASEYGEEGRQYFHKLAQLSPTYKQGENDKKYDNALRTGKKTNISTLVYIAKKNNIDVSSAYMHEITYIDTDYVMPKYERPESTDFSTMPMEWVDKATNIALQGSLYKGLINLSFLQNDCVVGDVFNEYKVGGTNDSVTAIFWQIDKQQNVRNGKTIPYLNNLHRDKTRGANWVHSIKKLPNYTFKQCPFGEHLFGTEKYKDTPMAFVVESEKTALICNIIFKNNPNFIWLAVGGIQNLNDSTLKDIKDKYIKLFADKDAQEKWQTKCYKLKDKGFNVQMIDWQNMFKNTEIGAKDDIADIIVKSDRSQLGSLREKLSQISCFG